MAATDLDAVTAALRALGEAEGGDRLAGQLSRLVVVIANEAVRTKRFRTELLDALVPTSEGDGVAVAGRRELERLTKAQLQRLIDQEGMDRQRTVKARTTKAELVDLILGFRAEEGAETPGADKPVAAAAAAVPESRPGDLESSAQVDAAAGRRPTIQGAEQATAAASRTSAQATTLATPPGNPPKRRRRPSPLDPYEIAARDGVEGLREELHRLDVEELKDVIAEYGMNHDSRAMGWTDHGRFVERILEKTGFGASQGSAFRTSR